MPRILKNSLLLDYELEEFMINCVNKDLTKKIIGSYEKTLKLFFKFLEDEFNVIEVEKVEEKHIREYLDFTKERCRVNHFQSIPQNKISSTKGPN